MGQARNLSIQMTTCPNCGLELRLTDDARGLKIVYDMRAWRHICARVHLGATGPERLHRTVNVIGTR
jgi:hypothetical protein